MVFKMIFNNKYFRLAIILVIFQQTMLALSTWFIARSGTYLVSENYYQVKYTLIYFFIFAILAYISSSFVSILTIKSKNIAWEKYTKKTINEISKNINLVSQDNQKKTISWISSESPSTLGSATNFYIQFTSIVLNIVFTFFVFFITLGSRISSILLIALLVSVVLVFFLRKKVENSSKTIQEKNLSVLTYIEPYYNKSIFGNNSMRKDSNIKLESKMNLYFDNIVKYSYLEQIIASTPIIIGVLAIIAYLIFTPLSIIYSFLGAIVAVLPRTLQLFGNVHSLSLYSTQFIMIKVKLKNLFNFTKNLPSYSLIDNLDINAIKIIKNSIEINSQDFLNNIKNSKLENGRYLISGENGAGKSSLLKLIKSIQTESILLSPNVIFSENIKSLSTGMFQIKQVQEVLKLDPKYILLDEWDANLDMKNKVHLDKIFNEKSEKNILIEVRHAHIE